MYADSLTLARARAEFFAKNGFSEKEYSQRIAKIKIGPLPIYFYNFKVRRRAIAVHDVHHILTGYETDILGEAQISAWELGSGYCPIDAAIGYLMLGTVSGLILDRKKTFAAFKRGLKCRNFYGQNLSPNMLSKTLGELRNELGLER